MCISYSPSKFHIKANWVVDFSIPCTHWRRTRCYCFLWLPWHLVCRSQVSLVSVWPSTIWGCCWEQAQPLPGAVPWRRSPSQEVTPAPHPGAGAAACHWISFCTLCCMDRKGHAHRDTFIKGKWGVQGCYSAWIIS